MDEARMGTQTIGRVAPDRARDAAGCWMVKTVNSYFRVAFLLGRYFITKVEHHNQKTRDEAITHAGDSWTGQTLVLQVGFPMTLYAADGTGVVRTTTVLEIHQ